MKRFSKRDLRGEGKVEDRYFKDYQKDYQVENFEKRISLRNN